MKKICRAVFLTNIFDNIFKKNKRTKVINMWVNGSGDMNKSLKGENPLPPKKEKANIDSWKCIPLSKYKKINCNIVLTKEEFDILSMGHIPVAMEDHWFMYCDENSINYFRSWTGIQIFKGYYRLENVSCVIYLLEINDNKDEYKEKSLKKSRDLFENLIISECKTYYN